MLSDTAYASFAAFYGSHLFDEFLAAGANVSAFWPPVFKLWLIQADASARCRVVIKSIRETHTLR